MNVGAAYWTVVLIWSATPLAIVTSNQSLTSWSAGGLRLLLALVVVGVIILYRRRPFLPNRQVALAYLVASLGLSPQMSLVYWAAQHVPSGVVSLVFSLNPCLTGLASWLILRDARLTLRRMLALALALVGMAIIYLDQLDLGRDAALGLAALLFSTVIMAVCSVWLKKITTEVTLDPFCQTGGTLLFALPVYALIWWRFDGALPTAISASSLAAVIYLAVGGSVAGFTLYFYLLRHLPVVTISLITLMTPVIALGLGAFFLAEPFTLRLLTGAAVVLVALMLFEGVGPAYLRRVLSPRKNQKSAQIKGSPLPATAIGER